MTHFSAVSVANRSVHNFRYAVRSGNTQRSPRLILLRDTHSLLNTHSPRCINQRICCFQRNIEFGLRLNHGWLQH